MPAPSTDFKRALRQLSDKEKEDLLLKAVRRDAELYDLLRYEILPEVDLRIIQDEHAERIAELLQKANGRVMNRALSRALGKAAKEIARAKRITKDKRLEVELSLYTLRLVLEEYSEFFNGYFQSFYVATVRMLLRTAKLVPKLHEDLWLEYKPEIDEILTTLRAHEKHRQLRYALPKELELPHL
ncbi:hypothetical protein [Hymenobacter latericus]|uniref:hypothetical protein n=1 Tax=Hymenobacter sp. YIM 151858-1 TaxID=2987688 RepID=UPI0022270803|nr:hypothetical protein [Hymenobacter sp. YIM 151858-1]UYZ60994.1 hypothetical protein OIS50_09350 [Hymenobacter sp. YIM 151858-1]